MKTAIVYDRVNKFGGAERVLLSLNQIFPDAPLYTAVYSPSKASWAKVFPKVIPSWLQKIPFSSDRHEHFPYLMPLVFESFDFSEYDLVISVTSEAAKGIITKPSTKHICYLLTPTRYLWSHYDFYFNEPPSSFKVYPFMKTLSKPVVKYLRSWDKVAAYRPDKMIAISTAVKKRIKKYYQRDSEIIFPPVEIEKFVSSTKAKKQDYYLFVSRLVPYKRPDLAIEAFNELGLPLIVIGDGSEKQKLRAKAKPNIKFINYLTDEKLAGYYQRTRGLIFPQEEDFGIVALEAQAAGAPVIAFKAGGALDTIIEGKTGIFFEKQSKQNLIGAVKKMEKMRFRREDLVNNAQKYSKEIFKKEFKKFVEND